MGNRTELALDFTVTAIDAACTLNLFLDRKGADEVYYTVWSSASITTPGATSASIGSGLATNTSFGGLVRIRWTVTASKTATFSQSLVAK